LYLLSKGANPGAVGPDGHTILNALEQRLSYCFGSDGATELVELYLAMSRKVQDPQQVKRLLVNFGVRAPLRYHTSRNSCELPAAYFELLRDPLVSPESWESVLKACGVTDTAAKKLLTQACGVVLPLVQHAVMGHPRTLMAVLDLPKVTVTQTLIKQSRSYGCHNTPLLEARTKQEREAIFAKMMEVQNPSGRR
jgi:hypothetical protein